MWFDFTVVIFVQFILFVILFLFSSENNKGLNFWKILLFSCLIGLPFGILFDKLIGEFASVYNYKLGFDITFLAANGLLSYGFMFATVAILNKCNFLKFYFLTVLISLIYEPTNYFFNVWEWTFSTTQLYAYFIVCLFAYTGLSLLIALTLHTLRIRRFAFLN